MNAILKHIENETLLRDEWGDGHEKACLYSALVPGATDTKNCPAEIMPQWLAHVTPHLMESSWAMKVDKIIAEFRK